LTDSWLASVSVSGGAPYPALNPLLPHHFPACRGDFDARQNAPSANQCN